MKKINKRAKAYKRPQERLKKKQEDMRNTTSKVISGILSSDYVLPDEISPAKKYFDSPLLPTEPPKKSQPFSVNFNTTSDGSISFNFLFHGFKE